ncbi:hypothetical protein TWF102_009432 [Orbilia oligospora]|uniref:BTB domain-containing protein n=1 Tax=Orbilia oligospora TaxID=2813651 RepID=A0A7C8J2U3_ORBOL|nr:hypothetical protein TWF102_009432 [Orbilia oligospora]KAF3094346.1 hypothetical protein TWF103_010544 [Orbilia oligospora]
MSSTVVPAAPIELGPNGKPWLSNLTSTTTLDDPVPDLLSPESALDDHEGLDFVREFYLPRSPSYSGSEADTESTIEQPLDTPSETNADSTTEKDSNVSSESDDEISINNIQITEQSDFVIIAEDDSTKEIYNFFVSKAVLSISSPYFRSLFQQHSPNVELYADQLAEVRGLGVKPGELSIAGDKIKLKGTPSAFRSVLSILHFCPEANLLDINFESVRDIAFVAEQYGWTKALQPWSTSWLPIHSKFALYSGYEDWLYVAKVFGTEDRVDELVNALSRRCSFNGEKISRGFFTFSRVLHTELWPSNLKDRILTLRQQRINHLQSCVRTLLCVLRSRKNIELNFEICTEPGGIRSGELWNRLCTSDHCHALAFGSLLQSSDAINLKIAISDKELVWFGSADELEKRFQEFITITTLNSIVSGHKCAIQDLKASLNKCLAGETILDSKSLARKLLQAVLPPQGLATTPSSI